MNVSAYRSICFSVAFSLLSVCVRAAETIDFNAYELGSVKGQPSAAASQWNSNLTATQNPVWVVVDGLGPDGSKCLSSTETASSTDQWVRADYSWDETVVSETGFDPEGIYLFSMDICLLQTSMPSGNMDVFVNYQQGANSLGNSNTRVTYFAIDGKGTINFQDAGWKRLNGFFTIRPKTSARAGIRFRFGWIMATASMTFWWMQMRWYRTTRSVRSRRRWLRFRGFAFAIA